MWPQILNLDVGEAATVSTAKGLRQIKVRSVEHEFQPDLFCQDNPSRKTIRLARVQVDVDGEEATLIAQPYQLPMAVNGVRLYVETTKPWAHDVSYAPMRDMKSDVRISALDADSHWGPEGLVFPIRDYRWRSSPYNNSWLSLVPYNALYYHRGEDYGAIPDRLDAVAPMDGTVSKSPLPEGDGGSNETVLKSQGCEWHFAHMNVEMMDASVVSGACVKAGQKLGRTGCTWGGSHSQRYDPHLHVGLERDGTAISAYPFLVEAYFNTYPDSAVAVAGGYAYGMPGRAVALDGTRSVARPGRSIRSIRWKLHDGSESEGANASAVFDKPGLYSEELTVIADDGYETRDFLQLRIYDGSQGANIMRPHDEMTTSWPYHTPVRGVRPGVPVLFWNRLHNAQPPVKIDFDDGTPLQVVEEEIEHVFDKPGLRSVAFIATSPAGQPCVVKTLVVVEDAKRVG